MTKYKFIGDPRDKFSGPEVMEISGMKFPRGEWVEVKEPELSAKLSGNSHFAADFDGDDDVKEEHGDIATDGSPIAPVAPPKRRGRPPRVPHPSPVEGE